MHPYINYVETYAHKYLPGTFITHYAPIGNKARMECTDTGTVFTVLKTDLILLTE